MFLTKFLSRSHLLSSEAGYKIACIRSAFHFHYPLPTHTHRALHCYCRIQSPRTSASPFSGSLWQEWDTGSQETGHPFLLLPDSSGDMNQLNQLKLGRKISPSELTPPPYLVIKNLLECPIWSQSSLLLSHAANLYAALPPPFGFLPF